MPVDSPQGEGPKARPDHTAGEVSAYFQNQIGSIGLPERTSQWQDQQQTR